MILIFKSSNQDIYFLFLKFILLFLLIKYFNINIFNFNIIRNHITPSSSVFFIIWYFLLFFLPSFYHLLKLIFSFYIYFSVIKGLIKISFLRDIDPDLTYDAFISENYNKELLKIK